MSLAEFLLTVLFGLPTLGFGLYWAAAFLELRVKAHRRRLSPTEAEAVRAQIAALQAQVDELRSGEARIAHLEEQLAFMERLLNERAPAPALPPRGHSDRSGT